MCVQFKESHTLKSSFYFSAIRAIQLKGQSHEKVGEMRVEGDSLGPN
jgi:hypothetical protein